MAAYGPYPVRTVEVHDGDTIYFDIDLGFGHFILSHDFQGKPWLACRVHGINAPELRTRAGKQALVYAQTLLKPGDLCSVLSYGWDKYGGRFDGEVTLPDGRDFGTVMIETGHAVPYTVSLPGGDEDG